MTVDDGLDGRRGGEGAGSGDAGRPVGRRLETLVGGGGRRDPSVPVRLVREFKGLTVDELMADERIAEMLPGRVRAALQQIERGDLGAAERALPGEFGAVLPGPWHERRRRRLLRTTWPWLVLTAAAALLLWWSW